MRPPVAKLSVIGRVIEARLAWLVTAVAVLAAAYGASAAETSTPNEIVMAVEAEPESLNPLGSRGGPEIDLLWQIYDGLFELGPDLVPRPVLAESVQVSRDGLAYTIRLKRGVTWHDGRPFTAEDVVFTIRQHLDPANASRWRDDLHAFAGFPELTARERPARWESLRKKPAEVVDRYTVRLNLRYPYAALLTMLVTPQGAILPKHRLDGRNAGATAFDRRPIGTGPFTLAEWRRGDRLVLEANPRYHRGRPGLDRVIARIIPEADTRLAALHSGDVQFLRSPAPEAIAGIQRDPRLATLSGEDVSLRALLFQLEHPALADARVRQAIASAIDAKAIRETAGRALAAAATGPIPPNSWAYSTEVRPVAFDRTRSRRLLAEAGYTPGPDGVLVREGRRLAVGLAVEASGNLVEVATAVKTQLEQVGVAVSVEPLEPGAWSERFAKGRYDILLLASPGSVDPDPITYGLFRSGQHGNTSGYRNPRVDGILDRARSARTQTERKALYAKLVETLAEERPIHVLYHEQRWYAFDRRYRGFEYVGVPSGVLQSLRRVRVRP